MKVGYVRISKDGKWLVSFPTGIRKENGKREYIYRYCETQREAIEVLEQLQVENKMGICHGKAVIKTGDWINQWIEDTKGPHIKPSTRTSYRNIFRIHIKPCVGDIVLRDLTTKNIQRMLDNIGGSKSTLSSKHSIAITAGLVKILLEHKARMQALAEEMGEEWTEDRLVFPNTWGNIVHTRNLQKTTERIYKKADIERATMHTLRHTYATRCFEAGVDIKAISEQLGHANVKTTYNTYIHLLEDKKTAEIDKLSGIDLLLSDCEAAVEKSTVIDISDRIA